MNKKALGAILGAGAVAVAVVYLVTRGGGGAEEPEEPEPGKANLYGMVKDKSTGKGLGGVVVSLDSKQTATNSQGYYTLADLDLGSYTLGFTKDGYTAQSGSVTLAEGNNEVNVELTPIGAQDGTSTFTVSLINLPDYTSGAYQYYVGYGGENWGMVDPQGGIWTPIEDPLTVTGPRTGTLLIHLTAGAFKDWNFYISGTFEDGEDYPLDLAAGIPGAGVALTDLVVDPDYLNLGETTTIRVTAINNEDTDMGKEIVFSIAGTEVGRKTVDLGPEESKEVSIEFTPSAVGEFSVSVDGLTARFEVTEYYPDVSTPKIQTSEWFPISDWNGNRFPKFKGTILLPALGKDEMYYILGKLSAEWDEDISKTSENRVSYIGNGLWEFVATAGMTGGRVCTWKVPQWHVKCPLCGWMNQTKNIALYPQGIASWAANSLASHAEQACYYGSADHCGLSGSSGSYWITQEDQQSWSTVPCPGTIMYASLYVAVLSPTGGDPMYAITKEWEVATAPLKLRITIDINGTICLVPEP